MIQRILPLFLITLFTMTGPVLASDNACNRLAKGDLSGMLLKQTVELRSQLVRGYHLPTDYASGYFARRIEPYLAKPNYSAVENPEVLYRGMFLTPSELEEILAKGMALKQVNWTAAGGGISFSSNANEAATYIFHAADNRENGIGVVFEVKKSDEMVLIDDPVLNSTRTIFKLHSDLRSSEIVRVLIWGQWGLESLEEIAKKAAAGKVTPHENWTGIFNQGFSR